MGPDELRAAGLGQSRGMPVLPESVPEAPPELEVKQGVIFVQFDAITTEMGGEDSKTNQSSIFGQEFAAFGADEAARAALMAAVRLDWAPYNVLVVDSRPATGDYTMNITSPTNPLGGGVLGIAPLDCFDMMTHNNVTFAFHGANDGFSAATQATTVGQEVAHSYGLEHVDEPADIMNPVNSGGDPSFMDECLPIVQGGNCGMQHLEQCGDEQSQNSHKELLALFGPSEPDALAPVVSITAPGDNAQFSAGASFMITVDATDENAISQVQLFNKEAPLQIDQSAPYGWEVADIPPGMYVFKVVATDLSGNEAESNVVTVYVGVAPGSEDTGSGDGSGAGNDEESDDDEGTDEAGQDGGDGGDEGCGCSQSGREGSALGLLGLAGLVRRRRRAVR
ncbi:MAG: Ig-like domain-containing protein [Deltaproteobacteria bacterium]|nr:Ig-like domain-containing protein [Nannocystaceae bacterium]